jgi:sugar O-acyltransferase (sialic acid O-acetyltransferase NeuD family)
MRETVIVGAGGVGREIAAVLASNEFPEIKVSGFVDDGKQPGTSVGRLTVLGGIDWLLRQDNYSVVIAFGNSQLRKTVVSRLGDNFHFPTIIHPGARLHDQSSISIGKGCYIADGCILTTDIKIADFCFVNSGCSLQHDTVLEPYCVLMPGVRITGGAKIGEGTYIAANCAISTFITIQENSKIIQSIY